MLRLHNIGTSIKESLMRMVKPVERVLLFETTHQNHTEGLGLTIKGMELVSWRKNVFDDISIDIGEEDDKRVTFEIEARHGYTHGKGTVHYR